MSEHPMTQPPRPSGTTGQPGFSPTAPRTHQPHEEDLVDQVKSTASDAVERAKEQGQQAAGAVEDAANQGLDRAAGAAQGMADTLRQQAPNLPGDRTTELAYQAAGGLERGAEYLRETDLASMRGDLEDLIRRHPTQSLMIGLAVGFLVARAFR